MERRYKEYKEYYVICQHCGASKPDTSKAYCDLTCQRMNDAFCDDILLKHGSDHSKARVDLLEFRLRHMPKKLADYLEQ